MIVQMKKVSLVVLDKERKTALQKLKKVGVVHLEEVEGAGEQLAAYKEAYNNAYTAVAILGDIKLPKKHAAPKALSTEEAISKCSEVIELSETKKRLFDEISAYSVELDRFTLWGSVNPDDFKFLSEKNIDLKMFEIPEEKYNLIGNELTTVVVNNEKKTVRFLLVNGGEERPEALPPEAYEVSMPEYSTDALKDKISNAKKEIESIDAKLKEEAIYIPEIEKMKETLEGDIQFETIYSGMGREEEGNSFDLAWISGFVPVDSIEKLESAVKENGWAMAMSDPEEEDNVPTKLKNNKLVSLIYPLTDFLGTVPGYHEYDISGWFLLFFSIFFGMIFGDGGYGLILFAGALMLLFKGLASKKGASPLAGLLIILGISTVAWGTVTCTWFGLKPEQLPEWLKNLSVKPLSNAFAKVTNADGTSSDALWHLPFGSQAPEMGLTTAQCLQIFCFSLALLQLSVAHIKGIFSCLAKKSLKFFGEFGSLIQLWGMFYVVLMMVVSGKVFAMDAFMITESLSVGNLCVYLVGGGFLLSFIFSNYDGSVLKSTLESCKNIISVLLGVVNVFSDIVSYIRLWAVGLAGAAISDTVNTMAGPMWGHAAMFAAFIALLVFGHGLNMILNLLSVIVHGVRLNTLEFSTHLGMSWSGFKYAPFAEKVAK